MDIRRSVLELALRQGGYVTRTQLIAEGLSPSTIDRRVNERSLTPAVDGVYMVLPPKDYVDLLQGAFLALPGAVVSHQSAAHLLRFPKLPDLRPTVVVPSHTTHRFPGVTVRRCHDLIEPDLVQVEGLTMTNVARTFFDLGGILTFKEWDAIGESLIIANRLDIGRFEAITERLARRGKRGSKSARDFLGLRAVGDPLATILEREGRAVLHRAGLPTPVAQYPIPWHPRRRFDDAFPPERIGLEWDSRAWHVQMAAMAADRQRDREAATHDWALLRFTWDDVKYKPDEIVETVSRLLHDRRVAT
jgi:hypothetical protein